MLGSEYVRSASRHLGGFLWRLRPRSGPLGQFSWPQAVPGHSLAVQGEMRWLGDEQIGRPKEDA